MSSAEYSPQFPTYEGWTNKPTWCVNLWLSNDEGLYIQVRDLVKCCKRKHRDDDQEAIAYSLGKQIQDLVEDGIVNGRSSSNSWEGLESDLMSWALAYVNWEEIAQAWLED